MADNTTEVPVVTDVAADQVVEDVAIDIADAGEDKDGTGALVVPEPSVEEADATEVETTTMPEGAEVAEDVAGEGAGEKADAAEGLPNESQGAAAALAPRVKGSEVFVGGLAREVVETDISEMFSKVGEIVELRLMKDVSGVHKGYAFVRYSSKESAQEAIQKLNRTQLKGRDVVVNPSVDQDTIFLGNLKKEWSQEEFEVLVRQAFTDVRDVQLAIPNVVDESQADKKRLNRGFAFVQFDDHKAAMKAFRTANKEGFMLGGMWRPKVDWASSDAEPSAEEMAKVKTVFIGNLPPGVTEEFLRPLFDPHGKVEKIAISHKNPTVPVAFVSYAERAHVDAAIAALDGELKDGPNNGPKFKLQVTLAKPENKNSRKRPHESMSQPPGPAGRFQGGFSGPSKGPRPAFFKGDETLKPVDAFEAAIVALHPSVAQRLLALFKSSTITRQDIDVRTLETLRDLPPASSLNVLDQFTTSNLSNVRNKAAYLQGIINNTRRQLREQGFDAPEIPRAGVPYGYGTRFAGGVDPRYASGSYQRGQEFVGREVGAYAAAYGGVPDPYARPMPGRYDAYGGAQLAGGSDKRPRFDPLTGQAFKYDPYTGEPILGGRSYMY